MAWQPTLLDLATPGDEAGFEPSFDRLGRRDLGSGAWIEVLPRWVRGADRLYEAIRDDATWAEHHRPMYDRVVLEPRLSTGAWADPPLLVRQMSDALSDNYDRSLTVVSANLYRDGQDSVAWHGDRVGRTRPSSVVAIVSLGTPRHFLLRPVTGGRSLRLVPGPGDLLVLGGTIQRTWQHCVPKAAWAGPRISLMFREEAEG